MSGGVSAAGVKGGQTVVGAGRLGLIGDADGGSGGRTYGGVRGDRLDGDGDRLNWWEDTVASLILGTDNNSPFPLLRYWNYIT